VFQYSNNEDNGESTMRNAAMISMATRTRIIAGLGALAVGIFVAATAVVVAPQRAAALPAYAAKEGKPCGYCHVNPAGGGARNAMGKKYEANGHTFKK
jgi:hypothetical protein